MMVLGHLRRKDDEVVSVPRMMKILRRKGDEDPYVARVIKMKRLPLSCPV